MLLIRYTDAPEPIASSTESHGHAGAQPTEVEVDIRAQPSQRRPGVHGDGNQPPLLSLVQGLAVQTY